MAKILVVDDELSIIDVLKALLVRHGHQVTACNSSREAQRILRDQVFDLMITDVRMPEVDGIELLSQARDIQSHLAVIVMTAYAGVDNAVEAMKRGAFDYVTKPFKFDELMLTIQRALSYEQAMAEIEVFRSTFETPCHFGCLVGDTESMLRVYRLIEKIARTNSTVLVLGESGTGKELVARALHTASLRHEGPFVTVNCAAMPETLLESELFGYVRGAFTGANANKKGLFEAADGGTILLDEIGAVPVSMQMKLLRVIQEREIRRVGGTDQIRVDVRVVAATNENLEAKVADGTFREDLYYRLAVIPIQVPPLRERKGDIPVLAQCFLAKYMDENHREIEISAAAMNALCAHSWPGNVRELENFIRRVATLCDNDRIEIADLAPLVADGAPSASRRPPAAAANPASSGDTLPLKTFLREVETSYLREAIARCGGDKATAARTLGISLATLYRKLDPPTPLPEENAP
jgi:DNA-binding NtrC family response regulator